VATYFVTGATGFIGRHLVERLLAREGDIHVLVRPGSTEKLEALVERLGGAGRIHAVPGDLGARPVALHGQPADRDPVARSGLLDARSHEVLLAAAAGLLDPLHDGVRQQPTADGARVTGAHGGGVTAEDAGDGARLGRRRARRGP